MPVFTKIPAGSTADTVAVAASYHISQKVKSKFFTTLKIGIVSGIIIISISGTLG